LVAGNKGFPRRWLVIRFSGFSLFRVKVLGVVIEFFTWVCVWVWCGLFWAWALKGAIDGARSI
jgi:hypothetical protein